MVINAYLYGGQAGFLGYFTPLFGQQSSGCHHAHERSRARDGEHAVRRHGGATFTDPNSYATPWRIPGADHWEDGHTTTGDIEQTAQGAIHHFRRLHLQQYEVKTIQVEMLDNDGSQLAFATRCKSMTGL